MTEYICPLSSPAPHASEPYLALATVYEDLGCDEKLLGILMIASHLKRSDSDMWVKTAKLAIRLNDLKIAIHCISKGVHACVCCVCVCIHACVCVSVCVQSVRANTLIHLRPFVCVQL